MRSKRAGSTPSVELAEIVVGLRNMLKLEVTTASGQSLPQNVLLDLAVPWNNASVQGETREGTRRPPIKNWLESASMSLS